MGCLSDIAKYLIFIFNFLIAICGLVLITFGALVISVQASKGLGDAIPYQFGGFALGLGIVVFLIAFFGCCGAIKENDCMLVTYASILIALLVIQVILAILAFLAVDKDTLEDTVSKAVQKLFDEYKKENSTAAAVDDIQQGFKCCGVKTPKYWGANIPNSCYHDETSRTGLYDAGCAQKLIGYIRHHAEVIAWIAVGFGAVELFGAVVAFVVRSRK